MHPDERANLEAEMKKVNDHLEMQPESKYFQTRKKELEKQLKHN